MNDSVHVTLTHREAFVTQCSDRVFEILRDMWSYRPKGYFFSPKYKLYLRAKKQMVDSGETWESIPGWDGRIRMFKYGKLPSGLFRATYREIEEKHGISFKVVYELGTPLSTLYFERSDNPRYEFQDDCCEAMIKALKRGGGLVIAATRVGKTKITAEFFRASPLLSMFVCGGSVGLLYQNRDELSKWLDEKVGIVGDSEFLPSRVTCATVQTLKRHLKDDNFQAWYKTISIVVVDEIHEQLNRRYFSVLEEISPRAQYGLTATLETGKQDVRVRAYAYAGPVIFRFPVSKGMKEGVLTKGKVLQLLFPEIPTDDDYQTEYREQVVENEQKQKALTAIVTGMIMSDRRVMVLVDRVKHVEMLSKLFKGIPHLCLYGKVDTQVRKDSRQRFEKGEIKLLISNKVSKKGITLSRLDCVVDLSEMKSKNDVLQKFGRGLGLHPDKDDFLYIDFGTQGEGRFNKAAISRRRALLKARIPIRTVKVKTVMGALREVQRELGLIPSQMKLEGM